MPDETDLTLSPDEPGVHAFVLRVRHLRRNGLIDRTVVHLDDVTSARKWHFTSLDEAFAEIRGAVKLLGETRGSPDRSH